MRAFHLSAGPAKVRDSARRVESGELKPGDEQEEDSSGCLSTS